jgi:hypothetical protein
MHDTDCGKELQSEASNDLKSRGSIAREVRPEEYASKTHFGRMTKYISGKATMDSQHGTSRLTNNPFCRATDP